MATSPLQEQKVDGGLLKENIFKGEKKNVGYKEKKVLGNLGKYMWLIL